MGWIRDWWNAGNKGGFKTKTYDTYTASPECLLSKLEAFLENAKLNPEHTEAVRKVMALTAHLMISDSDVDNWEVLREGIIQDELAKELIVRQCDAWKQSALEKNNTVAAQAYELVAISFAVGTNNDPIAVVVDQLVTPMISKSLSDFPEITKIEI